MIRYTVICDICGAEKREVNHWWVGWKSENERIIIAPSEKGDKRCVHLCGSACVHKWVSAQMEVTR